MGFVVLARQFITVRLASQRDKTFYLAAGGFTWLGEKRNLSALVFRETERRRDAASSEEEILVGTELLRDCRIEIDFSKRAVHIARI
jgi:hypothetical protein